MAVACARLVFLVILHLALFFSVVRPKCSASGPVWTRLTVTSWCLWFRLQKTVESPQLQSIKVVDISFVVHRPIPMVLATIDSPVARGYGGRCAFVAGRAVLHRRDAEACPMVQTGRQSGFPSCTCTRCTMPLLCRSCGFHRSTYPCRDAKAALHGLVYHGDSPVLHRQGDCCPLFEQVEQVERLPVPSCMCQTT